MVRQEGSGLFKDVHLGHSPMGINGDHLRGVLELDMLVPIRRTPFQVWKVTGTKISPCAPVR